MTPKEKAEELVDKYRTYIRTGDKYEYLDAEDEVHLAKQCALIAVNEILDICKTYLSSYYLEVKEEIQKL